MNWPLLPLSIDWFFTVSVAAVFVFLNFFSLFNNQLHTTNKQILKMNSFCLICVTIFSQSRLFAYFLLLFWFILFLIRIRSVVTVHTMSNSTTQTHSGSLLTHSSSQFLAIISARHTFARTSRTNSKSIKQINKKKTKREFCVFCFILSLLGIHFCWLLLSLTTHYTGLSLKKIAFHLLAPVWRTKYYAVCRLYGNIKKNACTHLHTNDSCVYLFIIYSSFPNTYTCKLIYTCTCERNTYYRHCTSFILYIGIFISNAYIATADDSGVCSTDSILLRNCNWNGQTTHNTTRQHDKLRGTYRNVTAVAFASAIAIAVLILLLIKSVYTRKINKTKNECVYLRPIR